MVILSNIPPMEATHNPIRPLPYYYISVPGALDPINLRHFELYDAGFADPRDAGIDTGHLPFIQPPVERLALARWIQTVLLRYGLNRLLRLEDAPPAYRPAVQSVLRYQLNDWRPLGDAYRRLGGDIGKSNPGDRIRQFDDSFYTIGCAMPLHDPWTLFTGESPTWSTTLLAIAEKSRTQANDLIECPVPISTSWNFNVALDFAGQDGVVIALHYDPRDMTDTPIRSHLLQELGQYGTGTTFQQHECEILLQPRLRVAYDREAVVPEMPLLDTRRFGAAKTPLLNLRIIYMRLLPPLPVPSRANDALPLPALYALVRRKEEEEETLRRIEASLAADRERERLAEERRQARARTETEARRPATDVGAERPKKKARFQSCAICGILGALAWNAIDETTGRKLPEMRQYMFAGQWTWLCPHPGCYEKAIFRATAD